MPAYYRATVEDFLLSSPSEVIGQLTTGNARFGFSELAKEQIEAWEEEITLLREQLTQLSHQTRESLKWGLVLEFPIPRRQQRIDAVLLAGQLVFVLEFKSGTSGARWSSGRQAEDYALDLSYFHAPTHQSIVIPVVIAPDLPYNPGAASDMKVRKISTVPCEKLAFFLRDAFQIENGNAQTQIDLIEWDEGMYRPVPTVIEAALGLYAGMSVREIARSHAGEENLKEVTDFLLGTVEAAQAQSKKIICFVTGIPGAGKTLAGLNLVHNRELQNEGRPASVFMSGNGPLVEILREALAIDFSKRTKTGLGKAKKKVEASVQNIHHFVQDNLERPSNQISYEKAIVFDEAQRAWHAERNRKKYKKKSSAWHISEPEMILKVMDRHADWSVVVALVGGGQEIHSGEAGLAEWGKALAKFPNWRVIASPEALKGGESVGGASLFNGVPATNEIHEQKALHLNVSIRSHQATELATWVNSVLRGDASNAARISSSFNQFPIVLTRDLHQAKKWLRDQARGERRCGLVASSGATRLRAYGIETSMAIREAYSYPHWFLKPRGDVRSSFQLEVVATEFEIQGLELDIVGLCWGGDLVWDSQLNQWRPLNFSGNAWKEVKPERATFIQNKYRVLMTRAREGLVIWVPEGDSNDSTRNVGAMNDTADYLVRCGVGLLK